MLKQIFSVIFQGNLKLPSSNHYMKMCFRHQNNRFFFQWSFFLLFAYSVSNSMIFHMLSSSFHRYVINFDMKYINAQVKSYAYSHTDGAKLRPELTEIIS